MELLDEVEGCKSRAAGGQQIIVDKNHVVGSDGVHGNLQRVRAILLGERFADGLCRQFAWLARKDKARVELFAKNGPHQKSAGLKAHYLCDALVGVLREKVGGHHNDAFGVNKPRSDVAEVDARLGEIGHTAQAVE